METKTVSDLQNPNYDLLDNSQHIRECLESINRLDELDNAGCLIVSIRDGDYTEVWRITGKVPYMQSTAHRLL